MSVKELRELLALSKQELQHRIGTTGADISDIQYAMSQEDWYRHIYTQEEIDNDMEHYRADLKHYKHQLQKLKFVANLRMMLI